MSEPGSGDGLANLHGRHPERRIGRQILVSKTTVSTNEDARRIAERLGPDATHGHVVTTSHQTGGRGTRGRGWWSPPGTSLALSVILAPAAPLPQPAILTVVAALAVVRAGAAFGADLRIKWPNDVVQPAGNKVAGILAETLALTRPTHVIGVGINIALPAAALPPELRTPPGSIAAAGGLAATPRRFLEALLTAFDVELDGLARGNTAAVTTAFNRLSWLTGRSVTLRRGPRTRTGLFRGMNSDLQVEIEDDAGRRHCWPASQVELVAE